MKRLFDDTVVRLINHFVRAIAVLSILALQVKAAPMIYIADAGGRLGKIDVATGDVTLIGDFMSSPHAMTDIAFDPAGNLWALDYNSLYRVDSQTGEATYVANHSVPLGNALVFGRNGTLYAAGIASLDLYTIDTSTGASTSLGDIGTSAGGDLAFVGDDLYLASSLDHLIRIDLNGTIGGTDVGPIGSLYNVYGLATGDNGVMYGIATTQVFSIDPSNGNTTFQCYYGGQGLSDAYGAAFANEAIPEPGTLALLAAGLIGLIAYAWRKRR